jgi:hypothetical protein
MENNTTFEQLTDEEEIEAYKGDQYVFYRPQKKYEVFSTSFGKYYGFVFGEGTFEV